MFLSFSEAVCILKRGGVLIYPTETFFGIGCRFDNEEAILRVFRIKRRALCKPLPLILTNADQLALVATVPPPLTEDVAELARFWPGPLTLLLPARSALPEALTAGTGNIAVRVSSHPVARGLVEFCGFPIVSTSANISKEKPVTSAAKLNPMLLTALDPKKDGVLDFPPAPSGTHSSTLVRPLGSHALEIRRNGAFSLLKLKKAGFTIFYKEKV